MHARIHMHARPTTIITTTTAMHDTILACTCTHCCNAYPLEYEIIVRMRMSTVHHNVLPCDCQAMDTSTDGAKLTCNPCMHAFVHTRMFDDQVTCTIRIISPPNLIKHPCPSICMFRCESLLFPAACAAGSGAAGSGSGE